MLKFIINHDKMENIALYTKHKLISILRDFSKHSEFSLINIMMKNDFSFFVIFQASHFCSHSMFIARFESLVRSFPKCIQQHFPLEFSLSNGKPRWSFHPASSFSLHLSFPTERRTSCSIDKREIQEREHIKTFFKSSPRKQLTRNC